MKKFKYTGTGIGDKGTTGVKEKGYRSQRAS